MFLINKLDKYEELNLNIFETNTIMFWIKLDNNREKREFLCGNNPFTDLLIVLEKSESNQISFYCGNGDEIKGKHAKYRVYTGRLPYNTYSHICFIRNYNSIKVYVNFKLINIFSKGLIKIGKSNYRLVKSNQSYLSDLTQSVKFFKIYNRELDAITVNNLINKDNLYYYFNDKTSKLLNIFNISSFNYRFTFNNTTFIYHDNMFVSYKINNYNEFVKFNYLSNDDIASLIDINTNINNNFLEESNIDTVIENIISWQFGMYQETNPKIIETSTIGFWSKRECNFFVKYTGLSNIYLNFDAWPFNGKIKYNYGSLQDGTGVYIKLIIEYYIKFKHLNNSLITDCLKSINIFVDYLNEMIYDNGGIPEYFPLQGKTFDNICLNDGAYMNYLKCCDFILKTDIKDEIDNTKIITLQENYTKALQLILNLQIEIDGNKTIWAQQYNPITLQPASARSFEKISLCSLESTQLTLYLMSIPNPSEEIKDSIYYSCKWFRENGITDYKQVINNNQMNLIYNLGNKRNLYTRYYRIDDSKPIFFDRDGNDYFLENVNNMPDEIRDSYTWLGCWGDYLLEVYSFWKTINLS